MKPGTPSHDDAQDGERRSFDRAADDSDKEGRITELAKGILRGRTAREILERLLDGDPLGIQAHSQARAQSEAYLVNGSRLYLRVLARVARTVQSAGLQGSFSQFIRSLIDKSIQELLEEDREAELAGEPIDDSDGGCFAYFSDTLGIPMHLTRRASIAFNALPPRVRGAYYAVQIGGVSFSRYVAQGHGPPNQVMADIEAAIRAISDATASEAGEVGIDEFQ